MLIRAGRTIAWRSILAATFLVCWDSSAVIAHGQEERPSGAVSEAVTTAQAEAAALEFPGAKKEREPSLSEVLASIQIVKHFRGPDGVEFVEPPRKPLSHGQREAIKAANTRFHENFGRGIEALKRLPPLGACTVNRTRKETTKGAVSARSVDVLYVRGPFPPELVEVVGPGVQVIECSDRPGDRCAIAAKRLNLLCLPTRVVVQSNRRIAHEGAPALRYLGTEKRRPLSGRTKALLEEFLRRQ